MHYCLRLRPALAAVAVAACACSLALVSRDTVATTSRARRHLHAKKVTQRTVEPTDKVEKLREVLRENGKKLLAAVKSGEPSDSITLKQAYYVQSLVTLQRYINGGSFPTLDDLVKAVRLLSEMPDSPFEGRKVHIIGIGNRPEPGAIIYVAERSPRGKLTGYWLIPMGTPKNEASEPCRPLPKGIPVPEGALAVLEFHVEGYVGTL